LQTMGLISRFLGIQSKQQEKMTPEGLAAALFVAMVNNKKDIEITLQNFSTISTHDVELELKFLKVFSMFHLIQTTVKDDKLMNAILKAFYSFFLSKSSEDYFGCPFESISEKLDMRIHKYSDAISEPNPHGPPYGIGKQFSRFIGYENDYDSTYRGALFFTSELKFKGPVLDNILKQYKFD